MVWADHVLPHGPLQQLASRLWQVKGRLPRGGLPRNMVVYQLTGGGLLIHSAIALEEAVLATLQQAAARLGGSQTII